MTIIPHELDQEILKERPESAPFQVDNDGAAEWAITRLAAIRVEQDERHEFAKAEMARITVWLENEFKPLEHQAAYFVGLLEDYARRQRSQSDRKSVVLPHGKITTRFSQPKFDINNETFLPWAIVNAPHLIRVKQEPSVSAMREHLVINGTKLIEPKTGLIVEGAVATAPELSITIKTEETENE